MVAATQSKVEGLIAVADQIEARSTRAIDGLAQWDWRRSSLRDNIRTAQAVAPVAYGDEILAGEVRREEKGEKIRQLKNSGKTVGMVETESMARARSGNGGCGHCHWHRHGCGH
ncbi:MAG: hypothetical protein R2941_01345 [Desulfobacterales bacterium]